MTVFATPASRLDRDADVGSRPVPWPGMLWVTWRQHRGLLITVSAALIGGTIWLVRRYAA